MTMKPINRQLVKKLKPKHAVIWDFDGVICFMDWYSGGSMLAWKEKLWQLLETYEPGVRQKFNQGLKYFFEHADYIAQKYGPKARETINRFYQKKELSIIEKSPLNKEIIDIINDSSSDIEHYIWSNNQAATIVSALNQANLTQKFTSIVSRDKVTFAKPWLDGFDLIQSVTQYHTKDFIFVGDSLNTDSQVAQKLDIDFFHYRSTE